MKRNQQSHQKILGVYVLDWYTSRYFLLKGCDVSTIKVGDMLVYTYGEKNDTSIGQYIGHSVESSRPANFIRVLEGKEKEYFQEQQALALKIFPTFKKEFKQHFDGSIPVTARYHMFADQLYLYFYSEERYVFTDFVRAFRSKIGKNLFLFQIGARDMMRMDPRADCYQCGTEQVPMHCKTTRELPSVDIEMLALQNLEGRDIERLKGRCGKLRCDLIYEADTYKEEAKKYPEKGRQVQSKKLDVKGTVLSFNIMNGDVTIRTMKNEIFRIPLESLDPF